MASPNYLPLLLLNLLLILPSLYANGGIIQDLILQACANTTNHESCLSNLQAELVHTGKASPSSVFCAGIRATLNQANRAISMITKGTTLSVDPREQMAVEDCKELLDFSVTELTWSLSEMRNIRSPFPAKYDPQGNFKAWLSAALTNLDTCLEGFEGTNGRIRSYVEGSLQQVSQLISNLLVMYHKMHSIPLTPPRDEPSKGNGEELVSGFPAWMTEEDRELLLAPRPQRRRIDVVVALDGSGHFRSITEAVMEAPDHSGRRFVIYVKKGIYKENLDLKKKKTNIMLLGDGIGATVITGARNFMQGFTTFRTPTIAVSGRGFIAKDMTFRNTAGPENHQAVALRVDSDLSAFYRCSMEGYQDTLYSHSLRQFYRECNIYGTIDFIFGNGQAVFQECKIFTRKPLPLQKVTITAQGRKDPHQSTGFSIQHSEVLATYPTYLGRPWKLYSRTVYLHTFMSSQVQPRGWLEWLGNFALDSLYYGEYNNYGPAAGLGGRVRWPGFHIIKDAATASFFTVERFIDGLRWLPSTGITFTVGLTD
ncbi:putative pectinesterase/pectinesterase inhibitor 22 [Macadamia integrifolia]|uniref:putative pectinesterase/pectinesterase inhibitor 22 n=1 Tax=Macadamia integrifolia TaxID=60698 RepID=UPI001C4EE643|nr:putative pectinesterase/pectinesterase inhibitor 22 [Macadamia integrifolia]